METFLKILSLDPEEFLTSLLTQTLRVSPFLELNSGQSSHLYQVCWLKSYLNDFLYADLSSYLWSEMKQSTCQVFKNFSSKVLWIPRLN